MATKKNSLRITEIFYSLQGESKSVGCPTVFIRLTGCPLRCGYCDTEYAFTGGQSLQLDEILQQVQQYNTRYITVTGGEPLSQKTCLDLLKLLCDQDYLVSLETSGALDISQVDARVIRVMDVKTPGSGEQKKNLLGNLEFLNSKDEVKFVICNKEDYLWSKAFMQAHDLQSRCEVLFSPVHGDISGTELADWILQDQLAVRFQVQLHKYLWNDEPGR